MIKEFKDFALKGNAITLAIGVVMGAAFNAVITSIVEKLFAPIIGVLVGGVNLATATFTIAGVRFGWGAVVTAIINFLITAVALFIVVKFVARLSREEDPMSRECPYCLTEIPLAAHRCPACTSEVTPAA